MGQQQTIGEYKTIIYSDNGYTKVKYHYTNVVSFNNNEIILNSGGWLTSSTKTRMNQTSNQYNLGFTVYQKNYVWFVDYNKKTLKFIDNMILNR